MAETIVGSLLNWLAPRAAEAKITGGPDEQAMLAQLQAEQAAQQGQYLPDLYQRITAAAQARPQTVRLQARPGLLTPSPADPRDPGSAGQFTRGPIAPGAPGQSLIEYDPEGSPALLGNTVAHELVHFLNATSGRPQSTARQHAFMQNLLGTDVYDPGGPSLAGYVPQPMSREDMAMLRSWLGGAEQRAGVFRPGGVAGQSGRYGAGNPWGPGGAGAP